MARIRTIKPELPHSPTLKRVSRETRLCFVLLWTLADDAGRARGGSRLLASLLYPYDDDAVDHMETWLSDLAGIGAIRRYVIDGEEYLDIPGWLKHQKIDKPSAAKYPEFVESSRPLASIREPSPPEGKGEEGKGREGSVANPLGSAGVVVSPDPQGSPSKAVHARGAAQRVFDYWRVATKHDGAKLTDKRRRLIDARLKDGYSEEQLCAAVDGCKASAFHQGENERAAVFDDIELICRTGEKLESFINHGQRKPSARLSLAGERTADNLRDWQPPAPPEARDGTHD